MRRVAPIVPRGCHYQGTGIGRGSDCAVQHAVIGRRAQAEIDDPRGGRGLHRPTGAVIRWQAGSIKDTLRHVPALAEPGNPEDAHRTDAHAPVDAGHSRATVADGSDGACHMESMRAQTGRSDAVRRREAV